MERAGGVVGAHRLDVATLASQADALHQEPDRHRLRTLVAQDCEDAVSAACPPERQRDGAAHPEVGAHGGGKDGGVAGADHVRGADATQRFIDLQSAGRIDIEVADPGQLRHCERRCHDADVEWHGATVGEFDRLGSIRTITRAPQVSIDTPSRRSVRITERRADGRIVARIGPADSSATFRERVPLGDLRGCLDAGEPTPDDDHPFLGRGNRPTASRACCAPSTSASRSACSAHPAMSLEAMLPTA